MVAHAGKFFNQITARAREDEGRMDPKKRSELVAQMVPGVAREMNQSPNFTGWGFDAARETLDLAQLPAILADVMHNELEEASRIAPLQSWREFTRVKIVNDFQPHNFSRVGGYGAPPVVLEGAAYTAVASPADEQATATVVKHGDTESITLEMMANDDSSLSALGMLMRSY